MCLKEDIDSKINRCKLQIATIYDMPKSKQCPITLEGFQRNLKFLLNEKSLLDIKVYAPRIVLPNGSECCAEKHARTFGQRALQACNYSIQQLKST